MIGKEHFAARPEDVGIETEKLEAVFARAERDIQQGILPAAQVAVARNGLIAGMRSYGTAAHGDRRENLPLLFTSQTNAPAVSDDLKRLSP